jgi:hypothetical protein
MEPVFQYSDQMLKKKIRRNNIVNLQTRQSKEIFFEISTTSHYLSVFIIKFS